MHLEQKIEGLLFYKGESMTIKKIADILSVSVEDVDSACALLAEALSTRGVALVRNGDEVMMSVSKELSSIIESLRKDEITKELSKASLETLSIVLYKNGPSTDGRSGVTRSEIDYIRGVNSSFILRNLLVRGLVAKESDTKDTRRVLYKPTIETLSYMGVTKIEDLPDYGSVVARLNNTINNQNND
ncbi:MAG: SMC-Scp complex subunit ScpB [Candidatus Pacebacteria bacterium]|nr:SMC-Scp complex subunit ScpB [Candidatus Paceibacterota bacterium]